MLPMFTQRAENATTAMRMKNFMSGVLHCLFCEAQPQAQLNFQVILNNPKQDSKSILKGFRNCCLALFVLQGPLASLQVVDLLGVQGPLC